MNPPAEFIMVEREKEAMAAGAGRRLPVAQPAAAPVAKVIAVSVQPAQVARGGETDLIVTYSLEGQSAEVVEARRVLKGKEPIIALDHRFGRTVGPPVTSAVKVTVPADATPGYYTLHVTLTAGGASSEGSALFEVR